MRLYKNNLRFMHDKFSQLEMDLLFELSAMVPQAFIMWPPFMHILIKRVVEAGYIQIHRPTSFVATFGGMQASPDHLILTTKGRNFIGEMGDVEL